MKQKLSGLLAVSGVVLLLGASQMQAEWPQWRGPARDGSVEGSGWPTDLSGVEPLWRVELGKGYPGPIVADDRVFVAETQGGDTEVVRALDRSTGNELWRASWPGDGSVPFFAASAGDWIRSTPAWDGESLFVGGMNEILVSLDGATGRENWRVDFPARFGTPIPDFGFVSSPLLDGDALFVQAANSLVKLDKATGKTLWRSLAFDASIMNSGAFSSPVMAELHGRKQLLVQTRETLFGVAPETGEVLWRQTVPHFRGMNILTPTVYGDGVFTSGYKQATFFYELTARNGGLEPARAWSHKGQGYMSSPVIVDGHGYLHMGNGRLVAIDLTTGQERWISQPLGKYWSMTVQGDKILALSDNGTLHLVRANPERFELLDSKRVANQPTWGHLAVSGDELFVRELGAVAAYRWRTTGGKEVLVAASGAESAAR